MKQYLTMALLAAVAAPACAQLADFTPQRLPITAANEIQNANGETTNVFPTSINNQGHMAGIRLTLLNNADPALSNQFLEESYIFDLNTQQYIAESIPNTSIIHIAEDYYIAKHLNTEVTNWQTYKCQYGDTIDNEIFPGDNPACSLIDDDALRHDVIVSGAKTWRGLYLASLFLHKQLESKTNTIAGDMLIADFTFTDTNFALSANVYMNEGSVINADDVLAAVQGNGFPDATFNTLDQAFITLNGEGSTRNLIFAIDSGENTKTAVKVALPDLTVTVSPTVYDTSLPENQLIGLTRGGEVYSANSFCDSNTLCDTATAIDTSALGAFIEANNLQGYQAGSDIFKNSQGAASFFKFCFIKDKNEGDTTPCPADIYYVSESNGVFEVEELAGFLSQHFSEDILSGSPFSAPGFGDIDEEREFVSFHVEGSPNGRYLAVLVPTTATSIQGYTLINAAPVEENTSPLPEQVTLPDHVTLPAAAGHAASAPGLQR